MHLMTSNTFKKKKSSPTIDFFYIKSIKKIISSFKTVQKLSAFSVFIFIMCPFNFCYLFFFSFISTTMPVFFSDHKPVLGDISTSASVAVFFFFHTEPLKDEGLENSFDQINVFCYSQRTGMNLFQGQLCKFKNV